MKKFRKIWLALVIIMTILFGGYRCMEITKVDSSGPVISMEGDALQVSIHDDEAVLLEGITAVDKKDGDVTSSVIVENISRFYGDHLRTVTYAAFDSDNHISKIQRELSYTDYTSPRFELTGSLRFRAGETVNIGEIATAYDCLDGDLSSKVKISSDTSINNRVTGFYKIVYEVTNSAGDTVKLPIDIEIYEPYNHEVELVLEKYLLYYNGEEIDYLDYLKHVRSGNMEYGFEDRAEMENIPTDNEAEVTDEGNVVTTAEKISKNKVTVVSEVDTSKPGVYPVYFYYVDEAERYTSEAKEVMYVVVE